MKAGLYKFQNLVFSKHSKSNNFSEESSNLVMGFGAKNLLSDPALYIELRKKFPLAEIALCSTAGEIYNTEVCDDSVSITALQFSETKIKTHSVNIDHCPDSYAAGAMLIGKFDKEDLAYLLILSDGSKVNGSELVRGLNSIAAYTLLITGGLAGDGNDFSSTLVGLNGQPEQGVVIGIGFYGDNIKIRSGSYGGWETFGPEKTVTKASGNVLFEINNENALELYKKYLGEEAASLPGAALRFPLSVTLPGSEGKVVRTILSIDEIDGSMTFAGDIPEGSHVQLMRANFEKITHAASDAARQSLGSGPGFPALALLISCVGRKLILRSRTEEEVEAVDEIFNGKTLLSGFYSYGEISPLAQGGNCQLNNQTMTITTFYETE